MKMWIHDVSCWLRVAAAFGFTPVRKTWYLPRNKWGYGVPDDFGWWDAFHYTVKEAERLARAVERALAWARDHPNEEPTGVSWSAWHPLKRKWYARSRDAVAYLGAVAAYLRGGAFRVSVEPAANWYRGSDVIFCREGEDPYAIDLTNWMS